MAGRKIASSGGELFVKTVGPGGMHGRRFAAAINAAKQAGHRESSIEGAGQERNKWLDAMESGEACALGKSSCLSSLWWNNKGQEVPLFFFFQNRFRSCFSLDFRLVSC